MRHLPEKEKKRKLAGWNTTNHVVCIICSYSELLGRVKIYTKTNIDTYIETTKKLKKTELQNRACPTDFLKFLRTF